MSGEWPPPVGSGLPIWLDTEHYLSADETRQLPSTDIQSPFGRSLCLLCAALRLKQNTPTQKAHVARKQMGGRKKGTDGPQARLCLPCHHGVDNDVSQTLAIRRSDNALVHLIDYGKTVRVLREGWC